MTIMLGMSGSLALAQKVLTVAAYPAVDSIVKAALPQWRQKHPDVEVKIISRAYADHHTAMTTALSTSSKPPDVMVLEFSYVARFATGGGLENLGAAPYGLDSKTTQFVGFSIDQARSASGQLVAVPTDIGPGTLLYRHDLLQRAGLKESDLTSSWDSYVNSGVILKRATGAYLVAHARDVKDLIIRSSVKSGEGLYFDAAGKSIINSERFVKAFELAKRIRNQKLDGKIAAWSNEWAEGFRRGHVATQMSGAWLAGHLNNWLAPETRGLWRAAQLPENTWAAWGGSFYAIPKTATHKALAWDLIQLMTLDPAQQLQAFKAQDAFPALIGVHQDDFFNQPISFLGDQKARLLWREATRHIQAAKVHKLDTFADEVVNTELDKVLDQGKDISLALQDAHRLLERRARR
ncbi:ABC transporter substrate-binding protein [Limnohabitans sp. Rim11]|uniref:ABC transporter substrate-binding protein n=1 Tax=Limnohabitans sp. Rim11 TaxID=1100719 RepID=UPI001E2D5598|nr:extracellular solute-binding protein [Limnohabitans sp. Rim11]